jgi:glycine/D-amino acid oxidase-like deaminating enzyme
VRNGDVSFWYSEGGLPARRPALPGGRSADVCIAGAGFTGLWTAYYLKRARPDLDVVVLEREFAGFGASGRNGGWLSADLAVAPRALVGAPLERAMRATVDEVLAVCRRERIEADAVKDGVLRVARGPAQVARLRRQVAAQRARGLGADLVELDGAALAARVRVAGASAATWSPHAARVQPAKLVQGLARAVERLGVTIHESTTVRELIPGAMLTDRGTVRAPFVLSCLEGFTAGLRGRRRTWLPLNSAMVVTEPLPPAVWEEIGWQGAELLGDCAHAYVYAQRTADGRIALGGRGVPYRYGSRTDRAGRTQRRTAEGLARILRELFPAASRAAIDHAWCGVLGVPRDWSATVRLDHSTGIGIAGGYVGHGVATSNLAGRTLADLLLGVDSELTRLPWVGHSARRWEPEPLRWLGAHAVYGLYRAADRREAGGLARTSGLARIADALAGR